MLPGRFVQRELGGLCNVEVGGGCSEICCILWVVFCRLIVVNEGGGASAMGLNINILSLDWEVRALGGWFREVWVFPPN